VVWRLLIHLDQAGSVVVGLVKYGSSSLELEVGGRVYLAHLALGRPEPSEKLELALFGQLGGAGAEEFVVCFQLLVEFEADLQA